MGAGEAEAGRRRREAEARLQTRGAERAEAARGAPGAPARRSPPRRLPPASRSGSPPAGPCPWARGASARRPASASAARAESLASHRRPPAHASMCSDLAIYGLARRGLCFLLAEDLSRERA